MAAVFSGNGDGSLHLTGTVTIPGGAVPGTSALSYVAFADINSDNHLDILFQDTQTGLLFTWFGDGTGQFHGLLFQPSLAASGRWGSATIADINGDGRPDIIFADDPLIMFGVGDGTFTGAYSAGPWIGCHLADFDKDGHLDLFCTLQNYKNGENYLEIHHGSSGGRPISRLSRHNG
jgi:FG-GAP-like repeat